MNFARSNVKNGYAENAEVAGGLKFLSGWLGCFAHFPVPLYLMADFFFSFIVFFFFVVPLLLLPLFRGRRDLKPMCDARTAAAAGNFVEN